LTTLNSPTPKPFLEVKIDSLSYFGGRGVGRHNGVVVFVPDTVPGDLVRIRISARKSKFWEGELVEVLEASPWRRKPPCPVAGRCGGCTWQQVIYAQQAEQKQKILRDSLRRLKGFEWKPFVEAPQEFHYRNRVQLQVREGRKGFFAARTRDLVEIERCFIAEEPLNEKMANLAFADLDARKVELALDEEGRVLTMAGERDREAALFSQVNRSQNQVLCRETVAAVEIDPEWIMDLYAGSGNITEPLFNAFPDRHMIAVELSQSAVTRGRGRLPGVEWHAGDVGRVLARWPRREGLGLVVLDPPRPGCTEDVIRELARLEPSQIIYVSCNPMTFARDAERLMNQSGFSLRHVRGLDMFPQTEHVELIASFVL
jgi:23S rRNA (uracil1939-C5)-methyltransferase